MGVWLMVVWIGVWMGGCLDVRMGVWMGGWVGIWMGGWTGVWWLIKNFLKIF